ncbi:MAG: serine/threonine-protein kinase [Deltaproteobacteria bacterium]
MTGQPFGRYTLLRPLAQGGMAELFLARQEGPGGFRKIAVVKRVLPHLSADPEFVRMFFDEASLVARLSHPNVVQIFDFGQAEGAHYLAMEYLAGESLASLVRAARERGRPMPISLALGIAASVCDGLEYLHSFVDDDGCPRPIIHRDISPQNLFATYQGTVKILDFGVAKAEGRLAVTVAGRIKGKLAYMSPEQAAGRELDGRSDIFALGAVLHELLTGERLFQRDSQEAIFRALREEPIPKPSARRREVPPEIDAIVLRALARETQERFLRACDLRAELQAYLSGTTYVSAPQQLRDYLLELFGEERARLRLTQPAEDPSGPVTEPRSVEGEPPPGTESFSDTRISTPPATNGSGPRTHHLVTAALPGPLWAPAAVTLQERHSPSAQRRGRWRWPAAIGAVALLVGLSWLGRPVARAPVGEPALAPIARPVPAAIASVTTPPPVPKPPPPPVVPAAPAAPAPPAPVPPPRRQKPQKERRRRPPSPATFGFVQINCLPWCHIFVDGRDTGRNSPAAGLRLPTGRHELELLNPPTGRRVVRAIDVLPDRSRLETVSF